MFRRWMTRTLFGQQVLVLAPVIALAACDVSANVNTALTYMPTYAQVRLVVLLPDASTLGAFIDVPNDLPTAWDLTSTSPGVTAFTQTVIGANWTFYLTQDEATIATLSIPSPAAGTYYTIVIAPQTARNSAGAVTVTLAAAEVTTQPPASGTAEVQFVSGLPGFAGGALEIGSTEVPGSFAPGVELAIPLTTTAGPATVTVTPPMAAALTFDNVSLPAGEATTLALVGGLDASSAQLIVVNDSFAASGITEATATVAASP